ncbi:MAG: 5-carboxymethyl-2-hydroxymuconate Delta-isomerase, partial [Caballeronia mineralivorans]|nr:5-carboxymethyl-2-hydroxymuconate Delta-isomerase [Caballeronia mineralivorans]
PPVFLKAGDTMTLGGSGLGEQTQKIEEYLKSLGAAWSRGEYPSVR